MLLGLGHDAVGGGDDEDRTVHLGGAGNHVLDEVSVARAVDVGVVAADGLVLDVRGGDGHGLRGVADGAALGDFGVRLGLGETLASLDGDDRGGRGRLAMVDVTDGTDVDVGLGAVELLFGHGFGGGRWLVGVWKGKWWSPRLDLNQRPRPYQGRALPTELQGRTVDVLEDAKGRV